MQHCIMEHQIMQTCIMGRHIMQNCILKHEIETAYYELAENFSPISVASATEH